MGGFKFQRHEDSAIRASHSNCERFVSFESLFFLQVSQTKIVRVGHPARLQPSVLEVSLDALVLRSDNSSIAKDIRKEMGALNRQILKTKKKAEIREARRELRRLSKEEKKRQAKVGFPQVG